MGWKDYVGSGWTMLTTAVLGTTIYYFVNQDKEESGFDPDIAQPVVLVLFSGAIVAEAVCHLLGSIEY